MKQTEREKGRRGERGSWFAGVLVLFVAWLLCGAAEGAIVTNRFQTSDFFNPNADEALVLHWTPLTAPWVDTDGTVITAKPFDTTLDSSGYMSNRIYAGCYSVTFGQSRREVWRLCVPTGDGTYSFWALATNSVTMASGVQRPFVVDGTNYPGSGVPIFGTNQSNVLFFPRLVGSGVTFTMQGSTQILATVTGAVGGGIGSDDGSDAIGSDDE
jgi:hypothetical protein